MVQRNDLSGADGIFQVRHFFFIPVNQGAMPRRRRLAMLSVAAASVAFSAAASKTQAALVTGFENGANYDSPSFTFGTFSQTVSLSNANTTAAATANATAIMTAMNAANSAGGGTVTIPNGTYFSSLITVKSSMDNVDLVLSGGTVLTDINFNNTLITSSSGINNFAITGTGIINGAATGGSKSSTKIFTIQSATNLLFKGITIENAFGVHFAPESDTNVTIDGININDNMVLSCQGSYIGNTDGIDYNGNNYVIENSSIQDGDDDIVDKTNANGTHGVLIKNDYIGAGHGIGVGGGFQGGIDNYTVNNITFNGTTTGLRIKGDTLTSGDSGGGTLHPASATYENITMTNVEMPIEFDSFYTGGENLPNSPLPGVSTTSTAHSSNSTNNDQYPTGGVALTTTTPVFSNVLFMNITSTDTTDPNSVAGSIFGENVTGGAFNVLNVTFYNVSLTANRQLDVWYAGGLTFGGLVVNAPDSSVNSLNTGPTNISNVYFYGDQILTTVPEPTSLALAIPALAGLVSTRMVGRRRRKTQA